jgi:hypothetical protein
VLGLVNSQTACWWRATSVSETCLIKQQTCLTILQCEINFKCRLACTTQLFMPLFPERVIIWVGLACHLSGDETEQGSNSLGLQVQCVVARVNFPHEETRGLYRTLGEQSKKLSFFSSSNLQNNFLVLCPQLYRVVIKHKV